MLMAIRIDGSFMKQLLERDGLSTRPDVAARRRELLIRIERVERTEWLLKLATAGFAGVTLLQMGLFFWDHMLELVGGDSLGLIPGDAEEPIAVATLICGVIALPLLLFYFLQQRTAKRARAEGRDLVLLELYEAVAGLQRQVGRSEKPRASA
jgi:hypothetical protein